MRVPRVYESTSNVRTRQNDYLNNSYSLVGRGCEFYAYAGVSETYIHGKIISPIKLGLGII